MIGEKLYAPLDHKTRASFTDNVHETYQLQMDAYDWLLQENGFMTAAKAYLAYYAPLDGELHEGFPFGVDLKELKTSPQRAQKLFSQALEIIGSDEPPQPSAKCAFCQYRKVEY
ncbi:MAG: PD-(D/E)XK nuclease family protein [Parcubacteria group bacterium]|nr:PD-(D/E)XK nuclease family protein [Parcubacteria group bacterium]